MLSNHFENDGMIGHMKNLSDIIKDHPERISSHVAFDLMERGLKICIPLGLHIVT